MNAILVLLICAAMAFAQPQQSDNFRIAKSVLDAGGGLSTSTNFRMTSAFGQPSPLGLQGSANFLLLAGFLSPAFQVSPLSPIQALIIRPMASSVTLHWPRVSSAAAYNIYRGDSTSFAPAPINLLGTVADTTFTDTDAAALPFGKKFYIVKALNFGGGPVAEMSPLRRGTQYPMRAASETRSDERIWPDGLQKTQPITP